MPDEKFKPALRQALRTHEIGSDSPYHLFFAAKANSGASFGFMQGDLAAGQQLVQQTFHQAMAAAGMAEDVIANLARRLSVHLVSNPLSAQETQQVEAALLARRDLVDAMDEAILTDVYTGLDRCSGRAQGAGRSIAPIALLYMAMWINMSGTPSKLLTWLSGGDPALRRPVPPAGSVVDRPAIETYLQATDYFIQNPRNFQHMRDSAQAGAALLPA